MREIVWVALGGALGSVARYLASGLVQAWAGPDWPWGILLVNIVGCLGMGVVMGVSEESGLSPTVRVALATGVLGGFTTFSAFAGDTLLLLEEGRYVAALANVAANVVLGLLAATAGVALSRAALG